MKAFIEILIRLHLNKGESLQDCLRKFAGDSNGWSFPQRDSEIYQHNIGGEGAYLVCNGVKGLESALVAIATSKSSVPNSYYVANIVPRDCFELTIDQYNDIGSAFARALRRWCRENGVKGSVRCSAANKTLPDIIRAAKCRKMFEQYLNSSVWGTTTLPVHPADIEKLDVFICALFRYGADVLGDEIERYLIVQRKWKRADANWVRTRIDTGLAVLRTDRKF